MAFIYGVANTLNLGGGWYFGPSLGRRVDHGPYPVINARNISTSHNNTVNMFIDAIDGRLGYGASIITACVDQTVYAIQCTSAPMDIPSLTCDQNGPSITLTSGPDLYAFNTISSTRTLGYDITASASESCTLAGTTAATCSASAGVSVDGTSTSVTTVATISGASYFCFDVEITGGAEKTVNPTATCGAKSIAVRLNSKTMAIWALASVIGVSSIFSIS